MNRQLYRAAASDDVKALQDLLSLDVDIWSEVSCAGNTVLHIAAFHGSKKIVRKLLPPSDLEVGNSELLSRQNEHGNTALHEAASGGHAEVVEILLQRSPDLATVVNIDGETAVFKAALAGHTDIIDKFEDFFDPAPMEIYIRESDGQTSLHCAVYNKRTDVVKKLLSRKHQLISAVDGLRRTPLHVAATIPPFKETVPPFHFWLKSRHIKENVKIANMLLDEDESLCDKLDSDNQNPLHTAVKEGNEKVMQLILERGGDCIDRVDDEGRNALHLAVINAELIYERNSQNMMSMLESLARSTKMLINDCDYQGKSALDIAIESMDKDELLFSGVKKLLEKHGATRSAKLVRDVHLRNIATSKSKWKTEIISWNAVLIGAAAFAAPFSLLGNSNPLKGKHFVSQSEQNLFTILFYAFFLANTVALGTSLGATVLLLFAVFGDKEDKPMVEISFMSVMKALLAILLAYGCAVGLLLGPEYLWLTVTVWFMLVVTPLAIRVTTFRSKLYIFTEAQSFFWFVVEDALGLIITLIYHVLDVAVLLLYEGFISSWRSKKCRKRKQ